MTRLVLASALALVACGELYQQRFEEGAGGATGRVVDPGGAGVVAVVGVAGMRARSSSTGHFVLADVPVGLQTLAAFDSLGRVATAEVRIIAGHTTHVGTLVVGLWDPDAPILPGLLVERRLSAGDEVEAAFLSRSGNSLLVVRGDDGQVLHASAEGEWTAVGPASAWPDGVVGLDDVFVYGSSGQELWRARHTAPLSVERHEVAGAWDLPCARVSAHGPLCWTLVPEGLLLEFRMPGDLWLWQPGQPAPSALTTNEPDGMAFVSLSPDGERVAFAPQPYNEGPAGLRAELTLASGELATSSSSATLAIGHDPGGSLVSIHIGGSACPQAMSECFALPVDLMRVDALEYDARHELWMTTGVDASLTTHRIRIDVNARAAEVIDSAPEATTWRVSPKGRVAFEASEAGFVHLFVADRVEPITVLAADHRLIGWAGGDLITLTRDPRSGVTQVFAAKVP